MMGIPHTLYTYKLCRDGNGVLVKGTRYQFHTTERLKRWFIENIVTYRGHVERNDVPSRKE